MYGTDWTDWVPGRSSVGPVVTSRNPDIPGSESVFCLVRVDQAPSQERPGSVGPEGVLDLVGLRSVGFYKH
jgi:hypothetical protein